MTCFRFQRKATVSMQYSHSVESNGSITCQEMWRIECKPKCNYRIHKDPPLVPTLSNTTPFHSLPSNFLRYVLILSFYLQRGLFPSGFPIKKLYVFSFYSVRTTCPAHLISFDFIILIVITADPSGRPV
jgi:hypothetical protein